MTLNGHFALKSVSGWAINGLASPAFGQNCSKTCRATHIAYCQRQKCSPGNVVSGSIRFMQIFAGVRWRGVSNESGIVENGDFRFIRSLSSEHFTYMATRQISGDTTVNDLGHISSSLDCFTSNFSKNGVWYGKSYYRQLIGNHTLAFDWCHFWWPWSTFEGHSA